MDFRLHELALRLAVFDRILLELALAGLIANGAVQRMVDQQRFEHPFRIRRVAGELG